MTFSLRRGALALALSLAVQTAASASDPAIADSCMTRLKDGLRFDPELIPKMSAKTRIDPRLSALVFGTLSGIQSDRRANPECRKLARELEAHFVDFALRRLNLLLTEDRINLFEAELANLRAPLLASPTLARIDPRLAALQIPFAHSVLRRLRQRIAGTRWHRMTTLDVSLENWSKEWEKGLGRAAPAAVNLEARRIAVGFANHEPLALEIFLFHELAHLWDAERRSDLDPLKNELFAWAQTVEYLNFLEHSGNRIPRLFLTIRISIRARGLKHWVADVMRSRNGPPARR